ncbi:chemotaxis regulatory protein ChePep [Helicobacter pylori]|uniref:chemotaxis regulatory protein ChePep n=1 Tax=Helicobacter pylori TaxID=210 RepID=UPI00135BA3A6|nr:chemotaxis regulatory protein ChePep [Helicobacter pylori]KAF0998789.1 poly E-rich protein [Helicobacter pylori SS1_190]
MKMILFNQNPMIAKLLESVSKKLELSIENFNHYQELSARLKKDPEWLLIADDECLEKLDQVDWLELKETISQNKNSVCMYKKGNETQPFLEGFEMKIKKPFLPTEMLKVLQKKLGSDMSELEPNQNLDPTQEVLETNWDELENLGDLEALAQEEPNNEEQLLPTLNDQKEKEEIKEEEKQEIKETPQEEKPKDDETQEGEIPKDEEVSKELEMQEKLEIPKEETQEEVKEEIKEETQEIKEEKQEETQDSPSAQELEAMQELVKEIQENSNENKKETQESTEIPQDKEIQEVVTKKTQAQELEIPKEKTQESAEALQETQAQELEKQENAETPQEKEKQEDTGTPQELEIPQVQEKETPQEETQETQEKEMPQTQDEKPQEDHYESIEDIPEPVMAKAMGEELPFLNEAVAKIPNNENDTETPKESVTETSKNENDTETPQEKEESDKTSSPLELRLNLQDLLKSLNQESLKSLLENKTLSIKITLEDKKPNA